MTKYNLSQIMKAAWNFKRTLELTMSEALKKSWAAAKAAISRKKEARKMTITISECYKTLDQLKARNGIPCIVCSNAYDRKDALKALGYTFDSQQKTWEKVIDPNHFADLCAETAIACQLSTRELDSLLYAMGEFQETAKGATYNADFTVEGLTERYGDYCNSIGY